MCCIDLILLLVQIDRSKPFYQCKKAHEIRNNSSIFRSFLEYSPKNSSECIKVTQLPQSDCFHSPKMLPGTTKLSEQLDIQSFQQPKDPKLGRQTSLKIQLTPLDIISASGVQRISWIPLDMPVILFTQNVGPAGTPTHDPADNIYPETWHGTGVCSHG